VKAEVVLPDRKHAKLWSGMRHEEYADEASLLKVVIYTCRVLPAAHALSSFFEIGKKLVYKILKDAAPDFHDLGNLGDPDKDVAFSCSFRFVARLYDQKKSFASSHHNINKLRVKLATSRDASLVRLPPSEATLRQNCLNHGNLVLHLSVFCTLTFCQFQRRKREHVRQEALYM
jgi:hypothetical protein